MWRRGSAARSGHVLWFLAMGLALVSFAVSPSALGASPLKQCIRGCKADRGACLKLASARKGALTAECTTGGATHRQCVGLARKVFTTSRRGCATLLSDCRACCKAGGQGPSCPVGHPIAFAPPPPADLTAASLPTATSGRPLLFGVPGAQLEIDPNRRDALTALGGCARWVTSCVVGGAHQLDDCARSVPPCATDTPWEEQDACCAATCFTRYQAARRSGTEAITAFRDVFYGADPCMPGVAALLRDGRP